jgi:hypothetical protein
MWPLLSVCPLRPPTDVAVAVKSGWILSMLPPVVAVLGLLYWTLGGPRATPMPTGATPAIGIAAQCRKR